MSPDSTPITVLKNRLFSVSPSTLLSSCHPLVTSSLHEQKETKMAAKTGINWTQRTQECHTSGNDCYLISCISQTIHLVKNECLDAKKHQTSDFEVCFKLVTQSWQEMHWPIIAISRSLGQISVKRMWKNALMNSVHMS